MTIQTQSQENAVSAMFSDEEIKIIRESYCKEATESEFKIFMRLCQKSKLDPFSRQIYFMKVGNKMTTITGIDGFRVIAERTGRYMPGKETSFTYDDKNGLFSATSYVKKLGPDKQWHEISATAFLIEQRGNSTPWQKMPHVMLAKCAESAALRKAFPSDLSGLYTKEEMDQAIVSEVETIEEPPKETFITEEQVEEILGTLEMGILPYEAGYTETFLKVYKIPSVEKLPADAFQRAMIYLNKKVQALQPK